MNVNRSLIAAMAAVALSACGGGSGDAPSAGGGSGGGGGGDSGPQAIPQLAAAQGLAMPGACESLTGFAFDKTTIATATTVAAGTLTVAGTPIEEHCRVTGKMNERVSQVDGQT